MATDSDRMARFTEAYRNLNLFPLVEAKEIEKFWVAYSQKLLPQLKRMILASEDEGKLVFTGHRGCGKSTLLNKLAIEMRKQGLFVAFFSIAQIVELSDVNHITTLYSIGLKLLSQATKLKVPIPEPTQKALVNWFSETKSETYSQQLKQELSAGVNVFDFFTGKLQREGSFREEIKRTYERRVSDLTQHINLIAAAIQNATQKSVLVIIDDLDKLDLEVVRPLFLDNIKALCSPAIRIVFTVPISVVREPHLVKTIESESRIIMQSVTKFFPKELAHDPEAQPIEANVAMLEAILAKRIPEDLIEPEVKRSIALFSGGVLRELVRLSQECCRECMLELDLAPDRTDIKIDQDILREAVKSLRNQFARTLGTKRYDLLAETYKNFTPPDVESEDFLELLHGLYVLEYENEDLWYDLHPLVTDLLKRRKLI